MIKKPMFNKRAIWRKKTTMAKRAIPAKEPRDMKRVTSLKKPMERKRAIPPEETKVSKRATQVKEHRKPERANPPKETTKGKRAMAVKKPNTGSERPMNYDELEAGPEMNAVVAEKVMGWKGRFECRKRKNEGDWLVAFENVADGSGYAIGTFDRFYKIDGTKLYCDKPHKVHFPEAFSTDPTPCMEALEKMREDGWTGNWLFGPDDPDTIHCVILVSRDRSVTGMAPTFTLAACRAMLKAVDA